MKHMKIMQQKIETSTINHIQGEILFLETMFPKHEEVEVDPLITFRATADLDTIYMHQPMKEKDK